jgi:hypothetical protein
MYFLHYAILYEYIIILFSSKLTIKILKFSEKLKFHQESLKTMI